MSYGFNSKNKQKIGDLVSAADPQGNTMIDFGDDKIDFIVSGSTVLSITPTQVTSSVVVKFPPTVVAGQYMTPFFFGDGSDANSVLDGTGSVPWATRSGAVYTMTRDSLCKDMTINSGVTLRVNNYLPYCMGTLTNNGTIEARGNDAAGSTPGATYAGAGSWFSAGGSGGAGGVNAGGSAGAGSGGNAIGGGGGNGGDAGGKTGGLGNISTTVGSSFTSYRTIGFLLTRRLSSNNNWAALNGSGGGGGGAGGNAGSTGGGGGGAVGICAVAANTLINNGTIQAIGGKGADGTGTAAGGGGGGAGGPVFIWTNNLAASGTIQSVGGSGGAAVGSGLAGGSGVSAPVIIFKGS